MSHPILNVAVVAVLLGVSSLAAQQDDRRLLQTALKLENDGQVEAAVAIYEQLVRKNIRNTTVVYRLSSAYQKLGHYDAAVTLLQTRLRKSPSDVTAMTRLSDVYYAAGRHEEADRQVEHILRVSPNQGTFASMGHRYERRNQDTKAASVYTRGRDILNGPDLFARELAQIYERAEEYPDAVREYGRFALQKPQHVALVEAKVKAIADLAEDVNPLFDTLLVNVKAKPRNSRLSRILTSFAIQARMTTPALDAILLLPPAARVEGSLLRLGRAALDEDAGGTAKRAFEALENRTRNKTIQAQAAAGIARALDLMGQQQEAHDAYHRVITSFSGDPVRDEATVRFARLQRKMGEAEAATKTLTDYVDGPGAPEWRVAALNLLADLSMVAEDSDRAKAMYGNIIKEFRGKEEAITATYNLSRVLTINGSYDLAQKALKSILSGGLATLVYNDAIWLSDVIDTGVEKDLKGLERYGEGLQYETAANPEAAAGIYTSTGGPLEERLFQRGVELYMRLQQWSVAFSKLQSWIDRKQAPPSWAHYQSAVCLQRLDRTDEALETFTRVLTKFPDTLEADRAREHITKLRRKPLEPDAG